MISPERNEIKAMIAYKINLIFNFAHFQVVQFKKDDFFPQIFMAITIKVLNNVLIIEIYSCISKEFCNSKENTFISKLKQYLKLHQN